MRKKRSIKIMSVALIIVLVCISIIYFKNGSKEILATTKEYNSELEENEHMHLEEDANRDKVPVPNGYVGSKATGENEIDTGYVIYEGTEEVNNGNVEEAQKTRNQYVWIPVPDASQMYGTDENGKKWGKLYEFTTDTGDNIDSITGAKPLNWSESNGVIKILNKSGNREPDVITNNDFSSFDFNSKLKNMQLEIENLHDFLMQLEKEFNNMVESVKKYGGFYMGRYETGDISKNKVVIRKYNTNLASQAWYTMYRKCKEINSENNNVETGMIWSCQWDRVLIWLIESKNKTLEEICKDSINWGNYINSTFEFKNSSGKVETKNEGERKIIPSGSSEYTKANNIYDLAGNVREWNIESYYRGRISRGGCTTYSSDNQPSSNRYNEPMISYIDLGCRAMLYIK